MPSLLQLDLREVEGEVRGGVPVRLISEMLGRTLGMLYAVVMGYIGLRLMGHPVGVWTVFGAYVALAGTLTFIQAFWHIDK